MWHISWTSAILCTIFWTEILGSWGKGTAGNGWGRGRGSIAPFTTDLVRMLPSYCSCNILHTCYHRTVHTVSYTHTTYLLFKPYPTHVLPSYCSHHILNTCYHRTVHTTCCTYATIGLFTPYPVRMLPSHCSLHTYATIALFTPYPVRMLPSHCSHHTYITIALFTPDLVRMLPWHCSRHILYVFYNRTVHSRLI